MNANMERRLVRVQEKGQVTLPAGLRRKLGLKKGDLVAFVETEGGVIITPQEVLATKALDRIGEILKKEGISLDDLVASGREERGRLIEERYGFSPDDDRR
jgi:antitoxin PrlF